LVILVETVLGVSMGIALNLLCEAMQMAGQLASIQMGYSLVNLLDPQTQVDTTVMSVFYQMVTTLIFFQMDVHLWILRAIAKSFEYAPPGLTTLSPSALNLVTRYGATVLQLGLQIAAPVLAATLVADVALGILGKTAPQMPLMLLGPALKSMFGLMLVGVALRYWPPLFDRVFRHSIEVSEQLLNLAH
jgi:flagellar biosynthetic protein FliR